MDAIPPTGRRSRLFDLVSMGGKLRLLALFLIVVGTRCWLVHRYAVSMPYWDQWDAEGAAVLKPWLEGTFRLHDLFAPHNEHRIVLTRLVALAIFAANGLWDGLPEMAANAVFCGGSAVCLARMLSGALRGKFARTVPVAVGLYFVLPFGWENTLCGFQSQVYFLILFSLLALWGLGGGPPRSRRWWIGAAGAVLACLSMASGLLAAGTVLAMLGARLALQRRLPGKGDAATVALCSGLILAGFLSRTAVAGHASLQAESLPAFAAALGRLLAWPSCAEPWLAWPALLPLGLLAAVYARRRGDDPGAGLLLGIGCWTILQAAALAYGRGGHSALPGSRYMDLLALVPLVGFLSWLALIGRMSRPGWRAVVLMATILWTIPLARELQTLTASDFDAQMPDRATALRHGEYHARGYVATHDFARFLAGNPLNELPYPTPGRLAMFLDDATLRAVLPADLRAPTPGGPGDTGMLSRWARMLLRHGGGLLLAGLLLALAVELAALARRWCVRRSAPLPCAPDPAAPPLRLLSVIIPARDEEGCITATVESFHAELARAGVPHEIVVVDDGSTDHTAPLLCALAARLPALRPLANPGPHGFGRAVVYGLDRMAGDAAVVVMADASDLPQDAVRYWHALQEGYDCVFGSRFARGGRVAGYPWFKRFVNRLANRFIRALFRVPLDDTTNAFKAYRREAIDGCRPLISPHFNLTVELPLKAIVRGFRWTVVPITWHNRRTGAAKFKLKEMGSRYLFVCLYIWLEKHLSRGDYHRRPQSPVSNIPDAAARQP